MPIQRCFALSLALFALGACAAPDAPADDVAPDPGLDAPTEALTLDPQPAPFCQDVVWYEEKSGTCPLGSGGPPITTCRSKCVIDKELKFDAATGSLVCKTVAAYCMAWVCECPKDLPD
jgi:hypothetical protein